MIENERIRFLRNPEIQRRAAVVKDIRKLRQAVVSSIVTREDVLAKLKSRVVWRPAHGNINSDIYIYDLNDKYDIAFTLSHARKIDTFTIEIRYLRNKTIAETVNKVYANKTNAAEDRYNLLSRLLLIEYANGPQYNIDIILDAKRCICTLSRNGKGFNQYEVMAMIATALKILARYKPSWLDIITDTTIITHNTYRRSISSKMKSRMSNATVVPIHNIDEIFEWERLVAKM